MNNIKIEWTEIKEQDLEGDWTEFECRLTKNLLLSVSQANQATSNQKITWWWHISILDNTGDEVYHVSSIPDTYFSLKRCKEVVLDFATNQLTKKIQDKIKNALKEAQSFTEILNVITGDE